MDFAIHFFHRLQTERNQGHDLEEATARTMVTAGKAILIDVASNVIGFGVFIFSGFSPIRNFGWLVSLTMLACALGTLVLLPALSGLVGARQAHAAVSRPLVKKLVTAESTGD